VVEERSADQVERLTADLERTLSATARVLFAAGSVDETLTRIVELAVETIDGCDLAGIFRIRDERVTTPASTDPLVGEIDALQFSTDEGPCLDAASEGRMVYAEDLLDDDRWPRFAPAAVAAGIRSVLAFRLLSEETVAALNLYARLPRAFGALDRAKGLVYATLADRALSAAERNEHDAEEAENLQSALGTRSVIGQAQGILMERERITADAAFDVLRRSSQHLKVRLGDVARQVVETGETPAGGSVSPRRTVSETDD